MISILKKCICVFACERESMKPIHEAVREGILGDVMRLSESEDVQGFDDGGFTPLHWAVFGGHVDVAGFLISKGADVDRLTKYSGSTPLRVACSKGQSACVELLLAHGADANAINRDGWTPLMTASLCGHLRVVRSLLNHHASPPPVDARSKTGATALYLACYNGHHRVALELLEAGAHPGIPRHSGDTPKSVAESEGHHRCVQLLEVREGRTVATTGSCHMHVPCFS